MVLPPEQLVATIIATSFAAGLNVYATVTALGVLARAGIVTLPAPLEPIASWWAIAIAATLFAIEFIADKIPGIDLIWNALQTFVRVPVAALLAFAAATPLSPTAQLITAAAGGGIALAAHGGKIAARAAVSASPEPFSNIGLSLAEDALVIFLVWFASEHPYLTAAIVLLLLVVVAVVVRWVVRAVAALFRAAFRRPPESVPGAVVRLTKNGSRDGLKS